MMQKQPCYVLDTNVLLDYPKLIPNGEEEVLRESTINLAGAHLIIPTAVVRELASFKKERSERGRTARMVLKRLRKLFENSSTGVLYDSYNLKQPQTIRNGGQLISILPIHKNFCDNLPFKPSDDDMDGQIILTTIAVACLERDLAIDGTAPLEKLNFATSNVVLLTNDNELAIRANARGVRTSRYGYKPAPPYTGRRDLEVPAELLRDFLEGEINYSISLEEWEAAMPNEPKLIANEFIVMHNDEVDLTEYTAWRNIGRYDAEAKAIVRLRFLKGGPQVQIKNAGQAIYLDSLRNPDIAVVICTGPAGTGKTFLTTVYALFACKRGDFIGAVVVPCQPEGKNGYLPGDLSEKMDPIVQPIKNALRNHLLHTVYKDELKTLRKFGDDDVGEQEKDSSKKSQTPRTEDSPKRSLMQKVEDTANQLFENWFGEPIPIEFARGRSFDHQIAIFDEFQDQSDREADTLIKRLGEEGKVVITGDVEQVHAAYLDKDNNGLVYVKELLMDDPAVAVISLTADEVVRHPLVQRIAERQKKFGHTFHGDVEETTTTPESDASTETSANGPVDDWEGGPLALHLSDD